MCLVIFGSFSITFYIFDPCILKFVFKRSIFLQLKILEARFWNPNSIFLLFIFPNRSTGNSNVQLEIRTFDQKFERSTGNSNDRRPICAILGRIEFLVELSNFWWNVRNSGRTFGKMKNKNLSLGPKNGLPEFFVEGK